MSSYNNDISNTGGPGSSAEPSMEEILASIRRILKEDDKTPAADVDIDEEVLLLDSSMVVRTADFSSATMPPALPPENDLAASHPDAPLTTYHETGHISSEATPFEQDFPPAEPGLAPPFEPVEPQYAAPEPIFEPAAEPVFESQFSAPTPVFEPAPLFEPASEPMPEPVYEPAAPSTYEPQHAAPEPVPATTFEAMPEPAYETEAAAPAEPIHTPAPTGDFTPPHESATEAHMSENVHPPSGIISEEASSAAASSIGSLVRSISSDRSVAISRNGITIEDIVREEIRPLLKAWLDSHLPSLVERIVRSEIERVVDRSL